MRYESRKQYVEDIQVKIFRGQGGVLDKTPRRTGDGGLRGKRAHTETMLLCN